MKRILSIVLAISLCLSMIIGSNLSANATSNTLAPTDLKVNLRTNPYGIDTLDPTFSWEMRDPDNDEVQTAYRVVISNTSALLGDVYDSGWVESNQNTGVHLNNVASSLKEYELYYWQVQTKDKDGNESPLSSAATFMTGIGNNWSSLDGSWFANDASSSFSNYTIDQVVSINSGNAMGFLGYMDSTGRTGYMIQIRNDDNVIKFYQISNGNLVSEFSKISLSDYSITLPKDSTAFGVRIRYSGENILVSIKEPGGSYVNTTNVSVAANGNRTEGSFGYRTGGTETGTIDEVIVKSNAGGTIYTHSFSSNDGHFPSLGTSSDGKLTIGTSTYCWYTSCTDTIFSHYTVTMNMGIYTGDALALLGYMDSDGKNGYMIQIRNVDNVVKAHRITNGTINTTAFKTLTLSDAGITLPTDSSEFGLSLKFKGVEIVVSFKTPGSSSFVNAGTINIASQGNVISGNFGFRTGGKESGTIDDISITSNVTGRTIFSSNFATGGGQFPTLVINSEKLSVHSSVFCCYSATSINYVFMRSPALTINPTEVDKAIIHLATRGSTTDRGMIADLYFNDVCLGVGSARDLEDVGSFAGGSGYTKVYYNSYDATNHLVSGDNRIGVIGNSFDSNRAILVQMTVFKKDGTRQIITNSGAANSGWKMLDGTSAFGDNGSAIKTGYVSLLCDNINTNYYPVNWASKGFSDTNWVAVQKSRTIATATSGTSGRVLTPYPSENTLRVATSQPNAKIYKNTSGTIILDLGKEIIGGLTVNFNSPAAATVTVRRGERLNTNGTGTVQHKLNAGPTYEDTWTLKAGSNVFQTVTMRAFRYVEFIGLSTEVANALLNQQSSVKGWAMKQEFDQNDSAFSATDGSASATLLNRLYELSKYTIEATNQDVYVDSQARERAPYEGDLLVNANTSYSVSDNYSLARHSNEWLIDNPTWPNDYCIFMVEMVYLDYLYSGDKESAIEYYSALKKKLTDRVASEHSTTGMIKAKNSQAGTNALIDWPVSERDGYVGSTYDVIFNSEYVGIYKMMSKLALALGKTADAQSYSDKSDKLKASLIQYAYNSSTGRFCDSLDSSLNRTDHYSAHATAYALCYGVYTDQAMADKMADYIYGKCKTEFVGSVYFTYFVLKGLYNSGNGDYAEDLLTIPTVGTNVKTFASVLDNLGCTITPEAWGVSWKPNMTFSHPWGASPGCSIVQGMFGINPTTAGFYTFDVKIQPGDIKAASVTTPTVQGKISVSYSYTNDRIGATVTIPANTKATVYLPVTDATDELYADNQKTNAVVENGYFVVTLGSGAHILSVEKAAPVVSSEISSEESSEVSSEESSEVSSEVSSEESSEAEISILYGDINKSGLVTSADALMALQHSVNKITLDDEQLIIADVDNAPNVTASDALLILQKSVDKLHKFPVETNNQ